LKALRHCCKAFLFTLLLAEKFILSTHEGNPAEGAKTRNEFVGFLRLELNGKFIPDFTSGSPAKGANNVIPREKSYITTNIIHIKPMQNPTFEIDLNG